MSETLFKVEIDGIAAGGAGLAKLDGKSLFIDGGIPGETVLCRATDDRQSWTQAELLEILEASPDRVQPACTFYGRCGGCNLQHLSYPAQIAAKTAILKDAFARIGGFCPPEPAVSPSEPWEYRNRMQFHAIRQPASPGSQGARAFKTRPDAFCGLKARKSADIIPVSDCPVADPGIRDLLRSMQSDGNEAKAVLISPGKDRVTVYAREGLLLSEGGVARGKTRILEKQLALDAGVFFQSNGAMLEKLVLDLREIVSGLNGTTGNLPMADLYCGVGTFAAFLGESFPGVDMVEENRTALALARENLARLGTANFHARRIEDWATAGLSRYAFAVADPPRQGLGTALTRRLEKNGPRVLAYVSCDPATLARDSRTLLGAYDLAELRWYDFYPQTAHIESLALFVRRNRQ
ncbi:MAG: methyltransferase [Treponema sp.]|nr:methyltransferase [Treponema sp.]